MRRTIATVFAVSLANGFSAFGQDLLVEGFESLDGWRTGGQKEIRFDLDDRHVKQGKHSLHLHVEIEHSGDALRNSAESAPTCPVPPPGHVRTTALHCRNSAATLRRSSLQGELCPSPPEARDTARPCASACLELGSRPPH